MMSAYGVDTLAPGLSLRRFWVLWNRLPPSTRVKPGVEEMWSQESYLLAAAVDWLAHLDYLTHQVYSKKRIDVPDQVDRPVDLVKKQQEQPEQQVKASPWQNLLRKLRGGEVRPRGR